MQKRGNVECQRQQSFSLRNQAFTLVELGFALGLSVLCVGLGFSYFDSHRDTFKKAEIAQSFSALAEAAMQQVALDLQGIDCTVEAFQGLLGLSTNEGVGDGFITRVPQDHPLFSDDLQTVRYSLLGEEVGRSAGLYREVAGQKRLLLPACKAIHVTFYVQDEAGTVLAVTEAKRYDRLAYAKVRFSVQRSCLQNSQKSDFETYVYYHYALWI